MPDALETQDLTYIHPDLRPLAKPIDELVLDEQNARKHTKKDLTRTKLSMERFGFRAVLTVYRDPPTGKLVVKAGNGRVMCARELGWTHLPYVVYEEGEEESMAHAIADNQTGLLATWNYDVLGTQLKTLKELDTDLLDVTGFSAPEVDALISRIDSINRGEKPETKTSIKEGRIRKDSENEAFAPREPITRIGEVVQLGRHELHCMDCMALLASLDDNSIDAVVTDPPYGLSPDGKARTWDEIERLRAEGKGPKGGLMGAEWDAGVPGEAWAREVLRVLKPGGHVLAFSSTRTYHRFAAACEDSGLEIRDQITWAYPQGFPKKGYVSFDIDLAAGIDAADPNLGFVTDEARRWMGWGQALCPSQEPVLVARKPLGESTMAANLERWGVGLYNINASRIPVGDPARPFAGAETVASADVRQELRLDAQRRKVYDRDRVRGFWPMNLYVASKPTRNEKNEGIEDLEPRSFRDSDGTAFQSSPQANNHPTVKPVKIMRWLLKLVTPPGGRVLEPFAGSGTTLVAAKGLDISVVASERDPGYCDIIRARLRP